MTSADNRLSRTTLRVALSLCELAASSSDVHVRHDLLDEALSALECVMDGDRRARRASILQWCDLVTPLLERIGGVVPVADVMYARQKVLRIRSVAESGDDDRATEPVPAPETPVDEHHLRPASRRALAVVRAQPDIRSSQIIATIGSDFSSRTIKRTLRELTDAGLLERHIDGRVVTYRSAGGLPESP